MFGFEIKNVFSKFIQDTLHAAEDGTDVLPLGKCEGKRVRQYCYPSNMDIIISHNRGMMKR